MGPSSRLGGHSQPRAQRLASRGSSAPDDRTHGRGGRGKRRPWWLSALALCARPPLARRGRCRERERVRHSEFSSLDVTRLVVVLVHAPVSRQWALRIYVPTIGRAEGEQLAWRCTPLAGMAPSRHGPRVGARLLGFAIAVPRS
jgi:hypothetical protein